MLSATFAILLISPFLLLRMSDGAGSFPKPLSATEEQKYIERCIRGDMEARNILIERNLRLVAHIIKKYYTLTSEQDDLISIGTIGLIKGISTYKPEKRVRLATYASRCIENEILMYFRSLKKTAGDLSLSDSIDYKRIIRKRLFLLKAMLFVGVNLLNYLIKYVKTEHKRKNRYFRKSALSPVFSAV